ncbi:MAG: 2-isopropylmalate synthase [Actinobacteria bacterium HGW-Actinobacteria-2]|nr:MAG: 2-isopropylmalate synthase [Actinobacteria bacterium HGW-Actinobacteria-2]
MSDSLQISLPLEPRGPAGAFILTDTQVAALGGGAKTFPVTVAVNDVVLRLRLARMGGENLIGLNKAARAQAGVELGETVAITICADTELRTVEVPDDLAAALAAQPDAAAAFERLAYSHRKEFVRWISEAKREQTRADRVAKAVEMVRAGHAR